MFDQLIPKSSLLTLTKYKNQDGNSLLLRNFIADYVLICFLLKTVRTFMAAVPKLSQTLQL